jgi:hypothetical protein
VPTCTSTLLVEAQVELRGTGDITGEPATLTTAEGHQGAGADIGLIGSAFDRTRARWTTKRRAGAIVRDQV